jgi:hypothetical protein
MNRYFHRPTLGSRLMLPVPEQAPDTQVIQADAMKGLGPAEFL